MACTVLYFAAAREAAGTGSEEITPGPADVAELRRFLLDRHPRLARLLPLCRLAVNARFCDEEEPIPAGAEVAVLPPVSGGAPSCHLVEHKLELAEVVAAVRKPSQGAVVTFEGDVRTHTHGREVVRLEYEAYRPMAEHELSRIATELGQEHGAAIAIQHRLGHLAPGEAAVVIACAAPHRTAAFRACEAAIERLKREVPIWKREVFVDGSSWVGLGP
ncbi:MAG TPA: molybdenum cofactor biosynthesis protein MoaE [Anaeromyxobacteraceae bacterium]|nr:molybdenum cofactor biosynthesis protein MoaE [Anaeromyxobacteraceae bacterium]